MAKCIYCSKFTKNSKTFCDDACEEKYESKIDDIIPRIGKGQRLQKKEIKMQEDFLKKRNKV